jgi:hypothetical protein
MSDTTSDVARLLRQIEQEYKASKRRLEEFAIGEKYEQSV